MLKFALKYCLYFVLPLLLVGLSLYLFPTESSVNAFSLCGPDQIGGTVFRDYNNNGLFDLNEIGEQDVTINAYDDKGNSFEANFNVGSSGQYIVDLSTNSADTYILEIQLPSYLTPGIYTDSTYTSTAFVDLNDAKDDCSYDFVVVSADEFCQSDPEILSYSFATNNPLDISRSTKTGIYTLPFSAGGTDSSSYQTPSFTTEAVIGNIGSVYGLAYQSTSDSIFASSFFKNQAGFGPGDKSLPSLDGTTSSIYKINRDTGITSEFLNTDNYFGSDSAGTNLHPNSTTDWTNDFQFSEIGKIGFGDLDISADQRYLWTINLASRELLKIDLGNDLYSPVAPSSISRYSFPLDQSNCPDPDIDIIPFGLGIKDEEIYIGAVCTAESTIGSPAPNQLGDPTKLRAYIYTFDASTESFNNEFDFALNYWRGCPLDAATCSTTLNDFNNYWKPWYIIRTENAFPEPLISDIEFDSDDLIIGFRDRLTDGTQGDRATDPFHSAGDIVKVCKTASGWELENNGSCGSNTGSAVGSGFGPGGGEYYLDDYQSNSLLESASGSLATVPGSSQVISTGHAYLAENEATLKFFNKSTGDVEKAYKALEWDSGTKDNFGEANALGDVELLCDPLAIEFKSHLWVDLDKDSILDPSESMLKDVKLYLENNAGVILAEASTGSEGQFVFRGGTSDNNRSDSIGIVSGDILYNMDYFLIIDSSNFEEGGALEGLTISGFDTETTNDDLYTTAASSGSIRIPLTTSGPGGVSSGLNIIITETSFSTSDSGGLAPTGEIQYMSLFGIAFIVSAGILKIKSDKLSKK